MKTLLLAPELFTTNGGIPRILRSYLKALCELAGANDQVKFVALNDVATNPVAVREYSNTRLGETVACAGSKARFIRGALALSRDCDRIICGHVAQAPVAWFAQKFNRKLRYEIVAHGIEVWRSFNFFEQQALQHASRIWCVSEFTRDEMQKHIALPAERFAILHNALDPVFELAPGKPLAECAPVIISIGRLSTSDRYKGIDHLIQALPAVRKIIPDAKLRIIGRGDDLIYLQEIAKKLKLLGTGVEFLGFVNDSKLRETISSCRLFALPSQREGFGLVFLEAMARGRPCLGADAGGIPEVIVAGTGVLTPYGDIAGLSASIVSALRGNWDEKIILAHARAFSYPIFKSRLAELLKS